MTKKFTVREIVNLRNRFKRKEEKALVVKELSDLTNAQAGEVLGIEGKYFSKLKTQYNCNFFQKHGIEY
jgi:hypothetical protein